MSMTCDQMLRHLDDPTSLNERTLGELREILEEYPYFQTAHLLYIRNLQMESNFRFAGQLKISAAYATDRTVLYHLLNPGLASQGINDHILQINLPSAKQELPMIEFSDNIGENRHVPEEKWNTVTTSPETGHSDLLNFELSGASYKLEEGENDTEKPLEDLIKDISHLSNKKRKGKHTGQKVDLIDRFIKDNPAFNVRQSENSEPDKNDEFITENLARIYKNQGLYQKAINAFEKLSLKYPEKNAYFARQIEEITNLINK